jgi:hypothetical protein
MHLVACPIPQSSGATKIRFFAFTGQKYLKQSIFAAK